MKRHVVNTHDLLFNQIFFSWSQDIANISNNDGTFQRSIRWISFKDSHRINSVRAITNHTVIYIAITKNEHRHYAIEFCRSLQRCKIHSSPEYFIPSEETHVNATLVDLIVTEFRRFTLHASRVSLSPSAKNIRKMVQ